MYNKKKQKKEKNREEKNGESMKKVQRSVGRVLIKVQISFEKGWKKTRNKR